MRFYFRRIIISLSLFLVGCAQILQPDVPSGSDYYKDHTDFYFGGGFQIPDLSDQNILPTSKQDTEEYRFYNQGFGFGGVYGQWYKSMPWLGYRADLFFTESDYSKFYPGSNTSLPTLSAPRYSWYGSFSLDLADFRYTGFGKYGYPYFYTGPSYEFMPFGAIGMVAGIGYTFPILDTSGDREGSIVQDFTNHIWLAISVEDSEYWYPNAPLFEDAASYTGVRTNTYLVRTEKQAI